ncbi:GNAT family acetyltransferase [Microbacterium sp. AK031]|uniref:GNAT family acetyltransferase n=1 Tax=Microbacterium sp. AK031 TaxID=2723076 RepID=UPI00286D7EB0|nr:GNAT family acetyltransferase [Microbacterium sp. AK031]MCS3842320.1 ribosomal protein S18 acetylase RimI-like enzyme [Microbacterium sp. AK031]
MRKQKVQSELFLVAEIPEAHDNPARVVGTVMAGYDGHRGWLYYLASTPELRGSGIGRGLVAEAERLLLEMGCPKVQLMVRRDNEAALDFSDQLGYERFDVANTGKRLISDEA